MLFKAWSDDLARRPAQSEHGLAGTIGPAKVLVDGALVWRASGSIGKQPTTGRHNEGYDVRPETREQSAFARLCEHC